MLNKISFEDFLHIVDDTYNEHPFELRYGQTIMNTLHKIWADKYNQIVATEDDCYYDDGIVKNTLIVLEKSWIDQ